MDLKHKLARLVGATSTRSATALEMSLESHVEPDAELPPLDEESAAPHAYETTLVPGARDGLCRLRDGADTAVAAVDSRPGTCRESPATPAAAPAGERLGTVASLRARLQALQASSVRPDPAPRAPSLRGLLAGGTVVPRPRVAAPVVDRALPGEPFEGPLGTVQRVVTTHDETHRHGAAEVLLAARALASDVATLALDPELGAVDFARALYIDTETTGLAGGAGTLPFLIGMAWFEGERLVVEQLLLPRPGLEAPMLARLAARIAEASAIVSYNGKSFDWPLLRTRFILNRIAAPPLPCHLDLLHCARRVYKARLGSVRLVFLEQELLGFERIDDMPGELIPETYLSFLRGQSPGSVLAPILDHNRSDLVALPALLGELLRRFRGEHAREDARDKLGFAKVAARALASDRAIACAHAACEADTRGEVAAHALQLVGELKLREGDVAGACEAFERALDLSVRHSDVARAHLALAKLHEHKTKQHARALVHALCTAEAEGEQASARRVDRLRARIARRQRGNAVEPA
jgi:uncharacterized protein